MVLNHSDAQTSLLAWQALAIAGGYFLIVGIVLHLRIRRAVRMVRYQPPDGISPAVACYLRKSGATGKPLAVAFLNMGAKGCLHIEQRSGEYLLSIQDKSVPLEPEEQAIAEVLFQLEAPISLKDIPLEQLATMIANVRVELESAVEPALVAQHFLWLAPGLTLSSWSLLAGVYSHFDLFRNRFGIGLILIPAFYSLVSVLAIIKTIPATFLKLKSHLLGSRARGPLPFVKQDLRIIYLVLMAVACVAMMGWIVSWPLALQLAILVTMCAIASLAFRTPTAQGYKLLDQLEDFCSFLAEVDGDRLNRANSPRNSSPSTENRVPWALALGIDHSWGEQFSAAVMNLAGLEESLDDLEANLPEQPAPEPEPEILDLNLK